MSLIESGLRQIIGQAFAGRLLKGRLRRYEGSSINADGDVVLGAPTDYKFEGIRENYSRVYAVQAGIPLTDVRVLIIGASIAVQPQQEDLIYIRSQWHKVRTIPEIDPANASYVLQCYEVATPS